MTGVEYRLHRAHAWLSLTVIVAFGLMMTAFGLLLADPVWLVVCLAVGGLCAYGAVHIARTLADKRPILSIGPDGLYSAPFADRVVPWPEITEMARLLTFGHWSVMGRVHWKHYPTHDQIHFAVADPRLYPSGIGRQLTRAMQRLGGLPPIGIQLYFVDADPDAVIAEIAKHWKGEIKQIDPRPRHLIQ